MLQNKTEDLEQSLLRYIKGMCKRCWIFWSNLYDFQSAGIWILTKCLLRCVSIPWFVSVVYFAFLVHWLCLCISFKRKKKHSLSLILVSVVHIWPLQDLTSYQRQCTDGESGTSSHVLLLTPSVQAHYSLLGRPRGLPIPAINISII